MQVLINGQLSFSGSEIQALKFAKEIAAKRQKSEAGQFMKKIIQHGYHSWKTDEVIWNKGRESFKLSEAVKKAAFEPLKFEFIN